MSKKALIIIIAAVLALTALGVLAQDNGPGVTNVTLPDGRSVPAFTDGRLNAFDIAAPVVVYYKAANGSVVNPLITTGTQPNLANLNFSSPNTLNNINAVMNGSNNNAAGNGNNNAANSANSTNNNASGNSSNNAANGANNASGNSNNNAANGANNNSANNNAVGNGSNNAGNGNGSTTQSNQAGLISQLEVLGVGPGGSTGLVLTANVEDLLSLVTGQQNSLSAQGYSVNFDPKANYFWVQAPADFEGKVYTFAWPNNIFPTSLIGQSSIRLTTSQFGNTNGNGNGNTTGNANSNNGNAGVTGTGNGSTSGSGQATAQPTNQGSGSGTGTGTGQATAQPTARPTTQATSQPAQPTATP